MKRYINVKMQNRVETVDEFELKDFTNMKEFRKNLALMVSSYRMVFRDASVYISQRPDRSWNNR